jgi:hypothetical protein
MEKLDEILNQYFRVNTKKEGWWISWKAERKS